MTAKSLLMKAACGRAAKNSFSSGMNLEFALTILGRESASSAS